MKSSYRTATVPVYRALLSRISARISELRLEASSPLLIAIDGRSGAGKSTLADHLTRALDATVIRGDDFFAGGTDVLPCRPEHLADICIDRARLFDVLATLKAHLPARYKPFDWDTFDGTLAAYEVLAPQRQVVIAEGVYTAHPDLRELIDFKVLIGAPRHELERRLLEREGVLGPWERQWHRAEDWYFETLAPASVFDIAVENTRCPVSSQQD